LQKEILESLEDAGCGPFGSRVLRIENVERKKELECLIGLSFFFLIYFVLRFIYKNLGDGIW